MIIGSYAHVIMGSYEHTVSWSNILSGLTIEYNVWGVDGLFIVCLHATSRIKPKRQPSPPVLAIGMDISGWDELGEWRAKRKPTSSKGTASANAAGAKRSKSPGSAPTVTRSKSSGAGAKGSKSSGAASKVKRSKSSGAASASTGAKGAKSSGAASTVKVSKSSKKLKKKRPREPRVPMKVNLAELCCGWMPGAQACRRKSISHATVLASDTNDHVKAFVDNNFDVETWVADVFDSALDTAPVAHGVVAGFPCQPYSSEGLGLGRNDERSEVLHPIIKYIRRVKPQFVVLENVTGLLSNADFEKVMAEIVSGLKADYNIQDTVLNAKDYALPQQRKRWYLVGIRIDAQQRKFKWPKKLGKVRIQEILDEKQGPEELQRLQHITETTKGNIMKAIDKIRLMGSSPSKKHFIIDVGSGRETSSVMLDCVPCITKNRGGSLDFWDTKLERRLSLSELMRCQGANTNQLNYASDVISQRQMGMIVGNAISITVLAEIFENVFAALGWQSLVGARRF